MRHWIGSRGATDRAIGPSCAALADLCYAPPVTDAQVIAHWRKRAREALDAAKLLADDGKYELALFHCHLAVEKALKAAVMEKTGKPHPKVHDLGRLATLVRDTWQPDDRELFETLSEFAIAARYDDPSWAETNATAGVANQWIERTTDFLSRALHEA